MVNGARKYAPHDWVNVDRGDLVAGIRRHLDRYVDGERADADSGLHPLAHAAARALMVITIDLCRGVGRFGPLARRARTRT